ncbi:endonuclease domain-containing protein [Hyphomonas sp.]|uniref:endonuclease domain-containing protein n=1 Tax=Hyphomonas sp. TaxID=87 RepID=UPI0025C050D6|nr:endonuclease domain-containing protein [Hyphomonas sp.]
MTDDPAIRHARRLRKLANAPEDIAWQTLRTLRDHGFPVRRQHPINGMIVDFAITRASLVIEIDGGIHKLPEARHRDEKRNQMLESLGWTILRIPSEAALYPDHLMHLVQEKLGL